MSDVQDAAADPAPKPAPATNAQTETAPGPALPDAAPQGPDQTRPQEQAKFDEDFPDRAPSTFDQDFPDRQPDTATLRIPIAGMMVPITVPASLDPEQWRSYLKNSPTGRVMSAFGSAFTGSPGMTEQVADGMRQMGIYNDVQKAHQENADAFGQGIGRTLSNALRAMNQDYLVGPLAATADIVARGFEGGEAAVAQLGEEAGVPKLGRDLAAMIEMATTWGHIIPGGVPEAPGVKIWTQAERDAWQADHARQMSVEPAPPPGPAPSPPTPAEAMLAEAAGRERLKFLDAQEAAGQPLTDYQTHERNWLRTDPHGDHVLQVYPFLRTQIQGDLEARQAVALPPPVAEMRALSVIGEGEEGYMGTRQPTDAEIDARAAAAAQLPVEAPAVQTVDTVARQLQPDLFREYDGLAQRRENLARWVRELHDTTEANVEANPPAALRDVDARIAKVRQDQANSGARSAADIQARFGDRLDALAAEREDVLDDAVRNHPDMVTVTRDLQNTDYRMRDLAPGVSRAMREAQDRLPAEPEEALPAPESAPPAAEPVPAAPEVPAEAPTATGEPPGANLEKAPESETPAAAVSEKPSKAKPVADQAQIDHIAQDVAAKLRAVGLSAEQAEANGQLVAHRYAARAALHEGQIGTARELYEKDFPHIRVGQRAKSRARSRVREMAQKAREFFQGALPTETPEFKAWFDGSVLKNKDGSPLVLFHGTSDDIHMFDLDHPNRKDSGWLGTGVYLTDDPGLASTYASLKGWDVTRPASAERNVMPMYANLRNPYYATVAEKHAMQGAGREAADAWTEKLKAAGHDGVILEFPNRKRNLDGSPPGSREIVVFDQGNAKSLFNRGTFDPNDPRILHQGTRQEATGSYTLATPTSRAILRVFSNHDASTFIHELGHHFLEELRQDAARPSAPEQIKRDYATVRQWLKLEEAKEIPRAGHERWARGFEQYAMEGRAPSGALTQVFERFRQWLTGVYKSVANLKANISPEIRDVYSRLLAHPVERPVVDRGLFDEPIANQGQVLVKTKGAKEAEAAADARHAETAEQAQAYARDLVNELRLRRGEAAPEADGHPPQHPGDAGGGAAPGNLGLPADDLSAAGGGVPVRGAAAPAGFGPPRPRDLGPNRRQKLYRPVPKRPPSLADWVKDRGGIDPKAVYADSVTGSKPGLFKPAGRTIEDLAREAERDGFFPESQGERPSPQAFIAKLEDDLRHNYQWSEHQASDVEAYQAARDHNAEVDRLAAELQIEQKGLSHGEFWDKVAERKSAEEQARMVESHASAAQDALEDADRLREEDLADRPASWEPDADLLSQPRSLEDLENERRQEDAARNPLAGPADVRRPGGAGARPAGVQEGAGPQRGGPGADGRRGSAAPGAGLPESFHPDTAESGPRSPEPRERGAERVAQDKAGNIRLENLQTSDDVDAAIRQIARDNDDFNSDRFGAGGRQFADMVKSTRLLLESVGHDFDEALEAATHPTAGDQELLAYNEAANRLTMVSRRVAQLTHDWGVAGHEFRRARGLPESAKALSMADLAERTKGLTLYQIRQEAQLTLKLETPAQRVRFADDMRGDNWEQARSMIIEYFVNNLISGPITHMSYMIGNEAANLFRTVGVTPIAAALSAVRDAPVGQRIYFGEIPGSLLFRYTRGVQDGWAAAARAWRSGLAEALPGELDVLTAKERADYEARRQPNTGAIPGTVGNIVRLPSRAVAAIHSWGRALTAAQEMWRLAYRSAADAGLEGDAFDRHMAQFMDRPSQAAMQRVNEAATRGVLMQRAEYGTAFWHLKQLVDKNLAAKLIAPFMQIGANLLHEGLLEMTPAGLIDHNIRDNLLGRNGAEAQNVQFGKMVAGISLSTAVVGFTLNGIVSGGGPSDARQRAVLMATGWQPYSIKIGQVWYPYRKFLGHLSPLIAGVANMAEIGHEAKEGEYMQAAKSAVWGLSEVIADESWFRGVSNFINAARNYDKPEGGRYWRDLAMDFIPFSVGTAQIARTIDPYSRQITTLAEAARSHVPGLSQDLMPRRNLLGDEIDSRTTVSPSPVNQRDLPLLKAMQEAQVYPTAVSRKIRGVELTEQQYDDYSRMAGRFAAQSLRAEVTRPGWDQMPGHVRHDRIRDLFNHARQRAQETVIQQSYRTPNDITAKALANQKAKRAGFDAVPEDVVD